jgi:CRP/FNR family cyclic AMP-dependent transcriptional regulator
VVPPEILQRFSFFPGLSADELNGLSIIARETSFQRGDCIFHEGDTAHALYLLLEGWVDVLINTEARDDQRALMMTLTAGDIFGWSAVVEPYVYTASAVCASPVKAISLSRVELQALFEIDQGFYCTIVTKICHVIASRLRATRLQMASLFVAN